MKSKILLICCVVLTLMSCRSRKDVIYFQNSSNVNSQVLNYELKIQTDDILYIEVLGAEDANIKMFNANKITAEGSGTNGSGVGRNLIGYLVDSYGYIDFPVLGKIYVAGLSKSNLEKLLKEKLSDYLSNPVIKIRLLNFKVTVLGEAGGGAKTVKFESEKVSIPQLLSEVGDLTLLSDIKNILIIREVDGVKTMNRIDMSQADVVNSPYYYLAQNDVVYIEPKKNKIDSGAIPTVMLNSAKVLSVFVGVYLIIKAFK